MAPKSLLLAPVLASALVSVAAQTTLGTGSPRGGGGRIASGNSAYDYAPSIMLDGVYRMWWCGQVPGQAVAGDHILYAESTSMDGPFKAPDGSTSAAVFGGTGNGSFDSKHTCDPSVVRANGNYYMFYGAEQDDGLPTTIGVASSPDGINWNRLNNDQAIITPANQQTTSSSYGAGQPSAIWLNGKFYIIFTDTTGAGAGSNGAGQFVWRSADPTFQSNVEVFTASGWTAMTAENSRSYSVVNAVSADWQYSDSLGAFIIAHDNSNTYTTLTFLDPDNLSVQKYAEVQIPGPNAEGPGIVSRPDKHSVASTSSDCGTIPVDVVHATGGSPPQSLGHYGLDVLSGTACSSMSSAQIGSIYESYGIQASGMPATVVTAGTRVQIANSAVYQDLAKNFISVPLDIFNAITYGASIHDGATVLGASGYPPAFQVDNNALWPVSCLKIITDNHGSIQTVDASTWTSYPQGPSLYCV